MQVFETQLTVSADDIDELRHVNNVQYLHWVNEAAKLHWNQNTSKEIRSNYYWVVLNHHIEYKSSAYLNDKITIKTYVVNFQGVTSTRIVNIYNSSTNKLLAKCETNWCLMNSKTNRPVRITQEMENLFN